MADVVHSGPTTAAQALRALRRYPDRGAFVSCNSSLSYRGAVDLIARMQAVFLGCDLQRGQRIGLLSANRAEAWCAGIAASASALSTTWLHPLGSLADQIDQLEDGEARPDLCARDVAHGCDHEVAWRDRDLKVRKDAGGVRRNLRMRAYRAFRLTRGAPRVVKDRNSIARCEIAYVSAPDSLCRLEQIDPVLCWSERINGREPRSSCC